MVYLEPITEETQSDLHSQTSGGTRTSVPASQADGASLVSSSDVTDPRTNLTSALRPPSRGRSHTEQDENDGVPEGIRNNGLKRWWHVMGMSSSPARPSSSHRHHQQSASNSGSVHSNSESRSGSESGNSSTLAIDMGDDGLESRAHGSSLNLLPPLEFDGDGDVDGDGLHYPISSMDNEAGEAASDSDGVVSLASLSGSSPTRSPVRNTSTRYNVMDGSSPKKGGVGGEGVDLSGINGSDSADANASAASRKVSFSQTIQVTKINSSPRRSPGRGTRKHLVYATGAQGNGALIDITNTNGERNIENKSKRRCSRPQLLMGFTLIFAFLAIVIGVSVHLINSSGKSGGSSGSVNAVDEMDDDSFATEAPTLELDGDFSSLPAVPTSAPTVDPYQNDLLAAADALLRSISPETAAAIDDVKGSPQQLAYEWITTWDEANLELNVGQPQQSNTRNVVTAKRYIQRFVLGLFYFSTGGKGNEEGDGASKDPFLNFLSTTPVSADVKPFLSASHECRWFGISCESLPVVNEFNENFGGESEEIVVSIDLSNVGLMGTIPDEIGRLEALEDLSLFNNDIFGTIPSSLMMLPLLAYIDLGSNFLSGSIAPLSPQLEFLYLNENRLTGFVPRGKNGMDYKLKHLWVHQCQLTGPLPDRLANFGQLEQLLLYENQITGTIPKTLSSLSSLSHLDLSSNSLSGSLPDALYDMPSLTSVYLSVNQLSGPIMSHASSSSRQLSHLWLDRNSFSGDIPSSFGGFLNLRTFLIHQNDLEGTMPFEVCDLFGARGELERLEADCVEGIPVNCTCCTECL